MRNRCAVWCVLVATIAGCGSGNGGSTAPSPGSIRTLAYVVTECHEDATHFSLRQGLRIQRGDLTPVTVSETPMIAGPALGLCPLFGDLRVGTNSVYAGLFQRLATSPDGSAVIFELTFQYSLLAILGIRDPLTAEQEGIFYVRADGTGLRRLGSPSREPAERIIGLPSADHPVPAYAIPSFAFSPAGTAVSFTDRGPGPAGDAPQIALLDIATGARKLLTQLPDAQPDPSNPAVPATLPPSFLDDQTVEFFSRTNPDGLNPSGDLRLFTVKTDGGELTVLPPTVALPGRQIDATFSITSLVSNANLFSLDMPGPAVNPSSFDPSWGILEIFEVSADHVLQLTNYQRIDTGTGNIPIDGQRVFFTASVDPHGENPSENCQLFWVDSLGGDPHQLTAFGAAAHSTIGCLPIPQSQGVGCWIPGGPVIDPLTGSLLFTSTCDPLGTNPNGEQVFAIRTDGTGLRQLTVTSGVVSGADGSVDVELPGPAAYAVPGGLIN